MPSVIINPGSGPVDGASFENAQVNIRQFAADLTERGHLVEYERCDQRDGDGRWAWSVDVDNTDNWQVVEMPGLPLEQVRWLGAEGQDIWDFPRLYVDGGSWIWFFALSQFTDKPSNQANGTVHGGEPFVFTSITVGDDALGAGQ